MTDCLRAISEVQGVGFFQGFDEGVLISGQQVLCMFWERALSVSVRAHGGGSPCILTLRL